MIWIWNQFIFLAFLSGVLQFLISFLFPYGIASCNSELFNFLFVVFLSMLLTQLIIQLIHFCLSLIFFGNYFCQLLLWFSATLFMGMISHNYFTLKNVILFAKIIQWFYHLFAQLYLINLFRYWFIEINIIFASFRVFQF